MKFTAFLLVALLAFATCNLSFLAKEFINPQGSSDSSDSSDSEVDQFFEGFFKSFGLEKPHEIIHCFSDKKSKIALFSSLYEKYELLKDSTERSSFQAHIDYLKLKLIYKALESPLACSFITDDVTKLLDALKLKKRDPERWGMALYLNFQAHYDDLYKAYQPLIDNLNAHNFTQAGAEYGKILNYTVDTIKKEGSSFQAFNGFGNGFAIALDIDEPSDSLECYDTNSSAIMLDFLYKLSVAVTDGKFYEAPINTLDFWQKEGKDMLAKIPKDVVDCDSKSTDHQSIIQALGIEFYSKEFADLTRRYVNNHRLCYYGYMKGLRSAFEDHNFIHAGNVYAGFVSAIAAKKD